jgi:hypothetical protein
MQRPAGDAQFVTFLRQTTIRAFFAGKQRRGVALAKALIAEARTLGPVRLHPVKTRIALMVPGDVIRDRPPRAHRGADTATAEAARLAVDAAPPARCGTAEAKPERKAR